jgi:hypothetical protein
MTIDQERADERGRTSREPFAEPGPQLSTEIDIHRCHRFRCADPNLGSAIIHCRTGNKRAASLSVWLFMAVNDGPFTAEDPDTDVPMVERIAAGETAPAERSSPGSGVASFLAERLRYRPLSAGHGRRTPTTVGGVERHWWMRDAPPRATGAPVT